MIATLRGYFHTAVEDLRYQGFEVFLWRIVVKFCSPLLKLDLQILFEIDLKQPLEERAARIDCTIERAFEPDLDAILDQQLRLPPPEALDALSDIEELQHAQRALAREKARRSYTLAMRAGEECYVARVGGEIAHSNWIRFHDCRPVESRPVELAPGEVYTTDAFTSDVWRGKGLHEAVLTHMLRVAQQRGCHHAYTITDLFKAGSRRGVRRIGWRERGRLVYITPRKLGRTWMVRLGGDVEPMFRQARTLPSVA